MPSDEDTREEDERDESEEDEFEENDADDEDSDDEGSDDEDSDDEGSDDEDSDDEDSDDEDSDDEGSDDEGSDDEDSDDEDSDDEDSDDEDSDDEDSDEDAETAPAKKTRRKTGRKKRKPKVTAGQRLAAAKAAKAAKKAALRGRDAEQLEDKATQRAEAAGSWLEDHRGQLMGLVLAVVVGGGIFMGWTHYAKSQDADAAGLLWRATETLEAPIVLEGEDRPEGVEEDDEVYPTIAARAAATLEPLDALLRDHSGSGAAIYAQLERGRALYQQGEFADARTAFQAALTGSADVRVHARALEGIAFTHESEEAWGEAIARFEELREAAEDTETEILADYHIARMHIAQDEEVPAKEKLQAVLAALREEDAPEMPYVQDQAELRLMAIDSSLVQRTPDAMDPEQMRRLIEQMQQQQQQQAPQ